MEQMINLQSQDSVNISHLYFKITNHGGYVAHFTVQYKVGGQSMTVDSGVFSIGMENKVFIPENATDITLTTSISVGIHWRVIDIKSFDTMQTACFVLHGTLFNPTLSQVNCTTGNVGSGNGSDIPLIPTCPCYNPCQCTSMMGYQDYMGMSYEQYLAYINSMNGMNNFY